LANNTPEFFHPRLEIALALYLNEPTPIGLAVVKSICQLDPKVKTVFAYYGVELD